MINLTELIEHPERMDRETLYDLRSLIALHPYYQPARLLMLQNLYLLHDPTFDEELRRAAIYISDRRILFQLIEAAHYKLRPESKPASDEASAQPAGENGSRTTELIDNFLCTIKPDEEDEQPTARRRKPTPVDATVDYVAYLLECSKDDEEPAEQDTPRMKGQSLIDTFISQEGGGRIVLPELTDEPQGQDEVAEPVSDDICTETMAQIYVRQGRYSQALEIIKRLNLANPGKNTYFADQIRFLEKVVYNNSKKNK